jgi:hypothetical protein
MVKKSIINYIFVLLVCLWLAVPAWAVIQYGQDAWDVRLDSDQSITCIAHFVWGSVEFNDLPIQRLDLPGYVGGNWLDIGWKSELTPDCNIAYICGPQITNTTGDDNVKWFAYNLSYLWDDEDPNFDPDWPVYIDTAIYDGPFGSAPIEYWGWRGTPGIPESWQYRDEPYAKDQPWYTEEFFDNPAPEPMTICLLGLGAAFLRKRRFLKIS